MNPILHIATRRKTGAFSLRLSSVGNPDFGQDPTRPLYGVPDLTAHVQSLTEARAVCQAYISAFDLGGGNWTGGEVVRADGLVVGRFSYNGRLWDTNGKEVAL